MHVEHVHIEDDQDDDYEPLDRNAERMEILEKMSTMLAELIQVMRMRSIKFENVGHCWPDSANHCARVLVLLGFVRSVLVLLGDYVI